METAILLNNLEDVIRLSDGADTTQLNEWLARAVRSDKLDIARYFIDKGAIGTPELVEELVSSVRLLFFEMNIELIRCLVQQGVRVSRKALMNAYNYSNDEIFKLIANEHNVNERNEYDNLPSDYIEKPSSRLQHMLTLGAQFNPSTVTIRAGELLEWKKFFVKNQLININTIGPKVPPITDWYKNYLKNSLVPSSDETRGNWYKKYYITMHMLVPHEEGKRPFPLPDDLIRMVYKNLL